MNLMSQTHRFLKNLKNGHFIHAKTLSISLEASAFATYGFF